MKNVQYTVKNICTNIYDCVIILSEVDCLLKKEKKILINNEKVEFNMLEF